MESDQKYSYSKPWVFLVGMFLAFMFLIAAPIYLAYDFFVEAMNQIGALGIIGYLSKQYDSCIAIFEALKNEHSIMYAFFCFGSVSAYGIMIFFMYIFVLSWMIAEFKVPYDIEYKMDEIGFKSLISRIVVNRSAITNVTAGRGGYAFIYHEHNEQSKEKRIKVNNRGAFKEFLNDLKNRIE